MQRRAIISALLLVGIGVVLGTTVFRTDIAQATGLDRSASVTVTNTASNPVPVQQQGTVRVTQSGTPIVLSFSHSGGYLGGPSQWFEDPYHVPAGQTLIITTVNGNGHTTNTDGVTGIGFAVQPSGGGAAQHWRFPGTVVNSQPAALLGTHFMLSDQTFVVAHAGDTVSPETGDDIGYNETLVMNGTLLLSGYLLGS